MKTMKRVLLAIIALPLLITATPGLAQKQAPPAGGPPKPFTVPAKQVFTLPNGIKVTMVPYGTTPKVMIDVTMRLGNLNESANQVWLADLTGLLLKEGTQTRSAEQISSDAAMMGDTVAINVGSDLTHAAIDVLSESGPRAAALLADIVQHPLLPASELPRLKSDLLRRLTIAKSQPGQLAHEQFVKTIFPDHPYGRFFPTPEMISGYTIEDVRNFYKSNFGAARTRIYVASKFDPAAMKQAITDAFGKWGSGPKPVTLPAKPASGHAMQTVDRPGAAQSTLWIGLPVVDPSSPDYLPLIVTNSLLGGSFGSRITSNIREQKGYTYSPYSQLTARYRTAYWVEVADVTTAVTGASVKEIFGEIDRLAKETPTQQELDGIKNYLSGVFVLQNSSRQGLVGQLNYVDLHQLGDDYLSTYVQKINAVTPQQVQEMTQKYLKSDQMAIVVVGDQQKIADQITPYRSAAGR